MSENESNFHKTVTDVINPKTEKLIGRISLLGNPVPVSDLICANGLLQKFFIVEGWKSLREVWVSQEDVLLRTNGGQCYIKITIYPTEGENQGFLDFTSDFEISGKLPTDDKAKVLSQRGLAIIQSLFSV